MRASLPALVRAVPVLCAAILAWLVVSTWWARWLHPYDLEWMEGGMLAHAWRLDHALPLYTPPSREWVPYIYPPGYASLLAVLGDVFPLGHPLGRALSVTGTLAAAAALVFAAGRQLGSWRLGWIAAGVFLGCYRASGSFYDLVRLDGVAIGLLAWALTVGMERRRGAVEGAAMLLAAAFLVKQHAAVFGLPMLAGIVMRDGRAAGARFVLFSAVPALVTTAFMQWASGGTYLTYLVTVPATHGMVGERSFPGTPRELGATLPVMIALATAFVGARAAWPTRHAAPTAALPITASVAVVAAAIGIQLPHVPGTTQADPWISAIGVGGLVACIVSAAIGVRGAARHGALGWRHVYGVGVAGVALLTSAVMRGHVGGFVNVHMPVHWTLCLGGVVAVHAWQRRWPGTATVVASELLLAAQVAALGFLFLKSHDLTPTVEDRLAGDAVVEALRRESGPICSPFNPWLAVQAGHAPGWHLIALWDINHKYGPMKDGVDDITGAFAEGWWPVLLDADGRYGIAYEADRHYDKGEALVPRGVFEPRTGWRAHPSVLRRPKAR